MAHRGCDRTLIRLFIINSLVRCHFGKAVPKAVLSCKIEHLYLACELRAKPVPPVPYSFIVYIYLVLGDLYVRRPTRQEMDLPGQPSAPAKDCGLRLPVKARRKYIVGDMLISTTKLFFCVVEKLSPVGLDGHPFIPNDLLTDGH